MLAGSGGRKWRWSSNPRAGEKTLAAGGGGRGAAAAEKVIVFSLRVSEGPFAHLSGLSFGLHVTYTRKALLCLHSQRVPPGPNLGDGNPAHTRS